MVLSTSSEDEAPPKQKPITKPKPKPKQSFSAALTKGSTIVTAESLLAEKPKAKGLSGAELRRRRKEKQQAAAEARRRSAAGAAAPAPAPAPAAEAPAPAVPGLEPCL